jgi:general nucleoside transport system ATP-binding protein
VHKRFGSVQALNGADFALDRGQVHALLGENGAGKSTMMQVAYGLVRSDTGQVRVNGEIRRITSPRQARELGMGMVHQHFTSVPALSVAENVALAAGWSGSPTELEQRARALCQRLRLPLEPDQRAGRLPVTLKQRLEIVQALSSEAQILLLDEPTAVLAPTEADELLRVVREFVSAGGSVVLITHKLDEVLRAADRVTVLRHGLVTHIGDVKDETVESLTEAMIGRGSLPGKEWSPSSPRVEQDAPPLIRLDSLEVSRESGYGIAVRHASLAVGPGDIIGVAAVEGNGQRELLRAIAGRIMPLRGRLEVSRPLAFIPEDRTAEGLIQDLNLAENVTLGLGSEAPWVRRSGIRWREAHQRTGELLQEFDILAPGSKAKAGALSGGNQQKLIVARELSRKPSVVVAENPTRGLDVGAAGAIHQRLRAAAAEGAAVIFHSNDLDEVLELGQRIVVVTRGVVVEARTGSSRAEIGAMMLGAGS